MSAELKTMPRQSAPLHLECDSMTTISIPDLTDEQFIEICANNPDLRIERTAEGDLIVMPPTGPDSGSHNLDLGSQLQIWSQANGTGIAFDSSTGFTLPNGAMRSPDASWIERSRLTSLTADQSQGFAKICPDFVVELRSRTDRLRTIKAKMEEYLANGARLGWLIDPIEKKVLIYRPGADVEEFKEPKAVSGEPVLSGFELECERFWKPPF